MNPMNLSLPTDIKQAIASFSTGMTVNAGRLQMWA